MLESSVGLVTLFFVDKPVLGHLLYQYIKKHPEQFGSGPFYFVQAAGENMTRFRWPRRVWNDFPLILEPQLAPPAVTLLTSQGPAHMLTTCYDKDGLQFVADETVRHAAKHCKDLKVICACNLSEAGAWAFARSSQDLLNFEGFPITADLRLMDLSGQGIASSFDMINGGVTTAGRRPQYEGKLLERRFEYNWWLNAHALLRPAMARCGLLDDRPLSKYELPFLYALRNLSRLTHAECIHLLSHWKGTGKHPEICMVSPKNQDRFLNRLHLIGALDTVDGCIGLSPAGVLLLDFLPKDCEDADLPMRLTTWKGLPRASQHKADTYLLKWFEKVKNRLEKVG